MQVRFFNGVDPTSQPDKPHEVLMIGLSPDSCPPPELHEAVRLATDEDMATYSVAYGAYEAEQKAKQEAERKAEAAAAPPAPKEPPAPEPAPEPEHEQHRDREPPRPQRR